MSERERPIRERNAVTYLRDFINTALILTNYEQEDYNQLVKAWQEYRFIEDVNNDR